MFKSRRNASAQIEAAKIRRTMVRRPAAVSITPSRPCSMKCRIIRITTQVNRLVDLSSYFHKVPFNQFVLPAGVINRFGIPSHQNRNRFTLTTDLICHSRHLPSLSATCEAIHVRKAKRSNLIDETAPHRHVRSAGETLL